MTTAATDTLAAEAPLLRGESLTLGYRGRPILPAFDVSIRRGRMLAVLGRNGSGKTTFFKTLLGFQPPVGGRIVKASPPPRLAFMGQAATVDPLVPLRAREVVTMGTLSGWNFVGGRGQAEAAAKTALAAVDAESFADRFVRDLSEGQRQRVLLARLLAAKADAVFLDEPTAAMDAVAEQRALALLRQWSRDRGVAVVIITHLLGLARRYADEVLYLDRDDSIALCDRPDAVFAHSTFRRQFGEID
ncbi:MAG TPA: ATP-binding cassette domain-containing protein [Polyangia bacterium]